MEDTRLIYFWEIYDHCEYQTNQIPDNLRPINLVLIIRKKAPTPNIATIEKIQAILDKFDSLWYKKLKPCNDVHLQKSLKKSLIFISL